MRQTCRWLARKRVDKGVRSVYSKRSAHFTRGTSIQTSYFTGAGASRWESHFNSAYYAHGRVTAPLQLCPFCVAHHDHSDTPTLTSSCTLPVSATRCDAEYYAPLPLRRHLSFCHAGQGYAPGELRPYNDLVIRHMINRQAAHLTPCRSNTSSSLCQPQPFRLIIIIDVANTELGLSELFLDLLQRDECSRFFTTMPIAVCAMQELFMPHTSKVLHAGFQLAQGHRDSEFYTLYAVSRLESGDLASAAFVTALRRALPRSCPPFFLITGDSQQRSCMMELYGSAESATTSRYGAVHVLGTPTASAVINKLHAVLESSVNAV